MKNICLIDADSTIPNLALMKLAEYYKNDSVELIKLHIPYYPNRKKIKHEIDTSDYDKVYCSVIFEGNIDYITGDEIIYGGTGFDLKTCLPDEIEKLTPDYSIYPENDISYGFISRGCIRNCSFCKVPKKEGKIRQVSTIDDIVRHKKVKFMDNNFLALPNHLELLQELVDKNIKHQFNQGLDIRLVTEENSELLSKLNYKREYIFAFDDVKYEKIIEKKIELLNWRKPWQLKFFVYVHPDMPIQDTIYRIKWLKNRECVPYLMRDIKCFYSERNKFYIDLAAWCNQPRIFKNFEFDEFLERRYLGKNRKKRINYSLEIYGRANEN